MTADMAAHCIAGCPPSSVWVPPWCTLAGEVIRTGGFVSGDYGIEEGDHNLAGYEI